MIPQQFCCSPAGTSLGMVHTTGSCPTAAVRSATPRAWTFFQNICTAASYICRLDRASFLHMGPAQLAVSHCRLIAALVQACDICDTYARCPIGAAYRLAPAVYTDKRLSSCELDFTALQESSFHSSQFLKGSCLHRPWQGNTPHRGTLTHTAGLTGSNRASHRVEELLAVPVKVFGRRADTDHQSDKAPQIAPQTHPAQYCTGANGTCGAHDWAGTPSAPCAAWAAFTAAAKRLPAGSEGPLLRLCSEAYSPSPAEAVATSSSEVAIPMQADLTVALVPASCPACGTACLLELCLFRQRGAGVRSRCCAGDRPCIACADACKAWLPVRVAHNCSSG